MAITGHAQQNQSGNTMDILDEVVVTAPQSDEPLTVRTNPKSPRQPIPAHDGSEYLKSIPGFSQIRKGGTDGDPVLRGMSGSRLNILLDGQQIYGGCGNRMDPPTAYVFPESYDQVSVIKGPQSVLNGAGSSAGAVLFEHKESTFQKPGWSGHGGLTVGSAGRNDQVGNARVGNSTGYLAVGATRTESGNYQDGAGKTIHSDYTRWSGNGSLGWTPNQNTLLEFSTTHSDGEAAYADRSMDGSQFERDHYALKLVRKNITPLIQKVDAQIYYNYVDHVMDNYTLRSVTGMQMASNPDRETTGAHLKTTLAVTDKTNLVLGVDGKQDIHTARSGSGATAAIAQAALLAAPRIQDMEFSQYGIFAEMNHQLSKDATLLAGTRLDSHRGEDSRNCLSSAGGVCQQTAGNNTQGAVDRETLPSGFIRYEHALSGDQGVWYAGLGHAERTADYWERNKFSSTTTALATGTSAFLTTDPEKTTQLDLGLNWHQGPWQGSLSGFYAKIDDYILIRWSPAPTLTRNVDATVLGGEADLAYKINETMTLRSSLAYVHGDNDTDNKPLAQQPPLEFRLAADYDDKTYSAGVLWRLAASQDRLDIGSGNIVFGGADINESAGFGVLSINGGYRLNKEIKWTAGVDNVLDKAYAEHLSNDGLAALGFPANTRINEPGRTVWVKLSFDLDR
ncbi:MAG: TonB-dependent copper receptor [Magnetococcales bacterium]|nr:TonB-dependent copper receptor [Magnetococcales bacterium]